MTKRAQAVKTKRTQAVRTTEYRRKAKGADGDAGGRILVGRQVTGAMARSTQRRMLTVRRMVTGAQRKVLTDQ